MNLDKIRPHYKKFTKGTAIIHAYIYSIVSAIVALLDVSASQWGYKILTTLSVILFVLALFMTMQEIFKLVVKFVRWITNMLTGGMSAKEHPKHKDMQYDLKRSLFTKTEFTFFSELQRQLPKEYYVFSKVRIVDFIKPKTRDYALLNRVIKKHVDFLICDSNFKPALVIELDGRSHNNSKQEKSDIFKDGLFNYLGLPFERVGVGSDFKKTIDNITTKRLHI